MRYEDFYCEHIKKLEELGYPKIHSLIVKIQNRLHNLNTDHIPLTRDQRNLIDQIFKHLDELGL